MRTDHVCLHIWWLECAVYLYKDFTFLFLFLPCSLICLPKVSSICFLPQKSNGPIATIHSMVHVFVQCWVSQGKCRQMAAVVMWHDSDHLSITPHRLQPCVFGRPPATTLDSALVLWSDACRRSIAIHITRSRPDINSGETIILG